MAKSAADQSLHALVTGRPGVGKTTLVSRVVTALREKGAIVQGFYTEEVRQRGGGRGSVRIGFNVSSLDGQCGVLARTERPQGGGRYATVGKYFVDISSFELIALPSLQLETDIAHRKVVEAAKTSAKKVVIVIDEIGKMELLSQKFTDQVQSVFERQDVVILATIPVPGYKPLQVVEGLRNRTDCQVFEVSERNRDTLVNDVTRYISTNLQPSSPTSR